MAAEYIFATRGIDQFIGEPDMIYANAGFQSERLVDTPDGPALPMIRSS